MTFDVGHWNNLLPSGSEQHEVLLFGSIYFRDSTQAIILSLAIILTHQYESLGEYCGLHTASSVFLILIVTKT